MDGEALLATIRDDHDTSLSRLGSSKALYALTGGEMDADGVLAVAAAETHHAARVFESWAETSADPCAGTFAAAADRAAAAHDGVAPADFEPGDRPPVYEVLSGLDTDLDRTVGLLAWSLVARRRFEQMVGFFVGDADATTADRLRDLRDDADRAGTEAVELLADVDDEARAREVADRVVETAYDRHVSTLEALGVEPKPVC